MIIFYNPGVIVRFVLPKFILLIILELHLVEVPFKIVIGVVDFMAVKLFALARLYFSSVLYAASGSNTSTRS